MRMLALILCTALVLGGCGLLTEKKAAEPAPDFEQIAKKPLPPEKAKELAKEMGGNWLYGQGLGETALAAGAIVAFPPFALYYVGNAALSFSGYEPIHVSDALPDQEKKYFDKGYDSLTSSPGKLSAALAGEEFRDEQRVKESYKKYLESRETSDQDRPSN